jgi:hypothetical protein
MQWSKLRASVRSLICPELRRRIDFHVTNYRVGSSSKSGLVTVDGKKVLGLSYYRFCCYGDGWGRSPNDEDWSPEQTDEVHPPQQLGRSMRVYLDMPVKSALKSKNPFIRSLAIVDRRVGRRTLGELTVGEDEHSLVKEFYRLRIGSLKELAANLPETR